MRGAYSSAEPGIGSAMADDERLKRAYGIDEIAAGLRDLGDEANPDLGAIPADELTDEQLLWLLLQRAHRRELETRREPG
jgi:hypothetical protein